HVLFAANRLSIRLHAAVEGVEVAVFRIRLRVDLGRLGVARAADLLGVPVGFGQDYSALAVGVCPDARELLVSLRAKLRGDALALLAHAVVDRFADLFRKLDALDAHIDDLDADLRSA